ncbi:MAG: hypothetical protein KDA32_07715 [Phycisphaerales bacterium]|nr:hypothetical protein [Phycisphaerales bacterium]
MRPRMRQLITVAVLVTVSPFALATNFLGVEHTNQGGATSTVDPNGSLLVSGLGPTGGTGVDALVGAGEFFILDTTLFNPATVVGGQQAYTIFGDEPNDPNQSLGSLSFIDGGSSLMVPVFFASTPIKVVEVLSGGMVVASGTVTAPEVVTILPISPLASANIEFYRDDSRFNIRLPATAVITVFAGPTVSGDQIRVRPAAPMDVTRIRRVEMRGANIGSFRIRDELIGKFGSGHRGVGNIELDYVGDCPTCEIDMHNPTPTVPSGMTIETRGLRSFSQTWQDLGTLTDGARIRFDASGLYASGPSPRLIGGINAEDTGSRIEITADFADPLITALRFEFYNGGSPVGTLTGRSLSAFASVVDSRWPTGAFAHRRIPTTTPGVARTTFAFLWDTPVSISPPGGGPAFLADEIRIEPDGPTVPTGPTKITTLNTTEEEVPDLVIDGENPDPGCDGDINGDDIVDLSDLAGMLAAFGTCVGDGNYAPEANLNPEEDDCVNLGDLAGLLANFGGCP